MVESDQELLEKIKAQILAAEPDRKQVNFVLAKLELAMTQSSPIKSEPIKQELVTNHIALAPNAREIEAKIKAERVKRAIAIVEAGDYRVAMFGRLPANSASILWRADGMMITPKGIKYEPVENEYGLPLDMPKLVSDNKREFPDHRDLVQRRHSIEAIHPETKMILHEPMGWCVVIDGYMHPLEDFSRGCIGRWDPFSLLFFSGLRPC